MISTLVRTAVLYFFVTFAIRIMGKRQIGDMQPNELVITLLISEIAAIPLQDSNQPVLYGIAAVSVLAILEITVSVITMKSLRFRKLLSGNSVILIKNGKLDQKALAKVRLTVIDLIELLRAQGVFSIEDVSYAILEVNGSLSVIQTAQSRPLKTKDIENLKVKNDELTLPVISDGKIIYDSLNSLGITNKQLKKILQKTNVNDIFLLTLDKNGNKTVILKEKKQ